MKKGFTLIELLVTIVIIGILTSVVLSLYSCDEEKGACESGKTEYRN